MIRAHATVRAMILSARAAEISVAMIHALNDMRPIFGNPADIRKMKEGIEKMAHADCECEGTLVRVIACDACDGTGEIEITCQEVKKY